MDLVKVFDYHIAQCTHKQAVDWGLAASQSQEPKLLVTLNPEIIMQAQKDPVLHKTLINADLVVADGIGVVWAAKRFGHSLPERIPGVDLAIDILKQGQSNLRVFFLGGKPGVAEQAANTANIHFGTQIAGTHHGYWEKHEEKTILTLVKESQAHLLLAGLGEGQEVFLNSHKEFLAVPLLIGVGGTLDVLSGTVQRSPKWSQDLGMEWAYRIASDRKRWHRFPRLLQFVRLVLQTRT